MRMPPLTLLLLASLLPIHAQVSIPLSDITPGTEKNQLIYNGDFSFQGTAIDGAYPFPEGWSRGGEMFAGPGPHIGWANSTNVAGGFLPEAMYYRSIQLAPDTGYMLSAYLWNMGDEANHATTVVDLNDAPSEAQLTLYHHQANAGDQDEHVLGARHDSFQRAVCYALVRIRHVEVKLTAWHVCPHSQWTLDDTTA